MTIFRFSNITFDSETRALNDGNELVYLRKKVADVLEYLLNNRQRVIPKEEFLDALWDHGEFRESSLIQSIKEIRKALNESANTPKFIRTVHQKGYEWIFAEVETTVLQDNSTRRKSYKSIILAFLMLCAPLAIYLIYQVNKEDIITQSDQYSSTSLAVLPFKNSTNDPGLDWFELGFSNLLAHSIKSSLNLQVVPLENIQHSLAATGYSNEEGIEGLTKKLIGKQGISHIISAEISTHNGESVFNYQIHTQKGSIKSDNIELTNLLHSIPQIVSDISNVIFRKEAFKQMPPSSKIPKANIAYMNGVQSLHTKGTHLAKYYFESAIEIDPSFQFAKVGLAQSLYLSGNWKEARSILDNLLDNAKLTESEDLKIKTLLLQLAISIQLKQVQLADNYMEELDEIRLVDDKFLSAQLLRMKAELQLVKGDSSKYHKLMVSAHKVLLPFNSPQIEAEALYYLGRASNTSLERDPEINLRENMPLVENALNYYSATGNIYKEALSNLAFGQNYLFKPESRLQALQKAVELFALGNYQFDLIDAQNYLAFFYLQYNYGHLALPFAKSALQKAIEVKDINKAARASFHVAFSFFDMGSDKGSGKDLNSLAKAKEQFQFTLSNYNQPGFEHLIADAHLIYGWTLSELAQPESAITYLKLAGDYYESTAMPISSQYTITSLMEEYLKLGSYNKIIALFEGEKASFLQYTYVARAYYELGEYKNAELTLRKAKILYPDNWSFSEENRLIVYARSFATAKRYELSAEQSSHLNYCEDLWNTDGLSSLLFSLSQKHGNE